MMRLKNFCLALAAVSIGGAALMAQDAQSQDQSKPPIPER